MEIYDFEGHELLDSTDYTGKWRLKEGLPIKGENLQNSVVSFDKYLVIAGENGEKQKEFYYFDVETEKWYDAEGEIDASIYDPNAASSGGGGGVSTGNVLASGGQGRFKKFYITLYHFIVINSLYWSIMISIFFFKQQSIQYF